MEYSDYIDPRIRYEKAMNAWLQKQREQKAKDRTARDLLTLITKHDPTRENDHTILNDITIAADALTAHGELGYALSNKLMIFVQEVEWLLNREKTSLKGKKA